MNIGDQVRFLNDVGGGKITGFRPGGIVLVEDEDGFDVPVPQNEVVVIEEKKKPLAPAHPQKEEGSPAEASANSGKDDRKMESSLGKDRKDKESPRPEPASLNGKEYLQSKTAAPSEAEDDIDENMEARIVRMELTIQKLEARIARLEAENNLRKNEKLMMRQAKPAKKPQQPTDIGDLQIL
ncbi:MAG: hypothetical protein K2I99_01155 [Bacteroidaceae bacterium]|nr:hypothetical protein [Bacteroidaceae bacterium]